MSGQPPYTTAAGEVDLLMLARTLWSGRRILALTVLLCLATGCAFSALWPWYWRSEAVMVVPSLTDNPALARRQAELEALGIAPEVTGEWLSGRFIRTFSSTDTQRDFVEGTAWFVKRTQGMSPAARARVAQGVMKGISLEAAPTGRQEKPLYPSLTAGIRMQDAQEAQAMLDDYLRFVTDRVTQAVRQTLESQRQVRLTAARQQLSLTLARETVAHSVNVTRLEYALSLAQAAGVTQPVFTRGEMFRDDPDFPLSLGEKGLAKKLAILNAEKDLRALSTTLQDQDEMIRRLEAVYVTDVSVTPFHLLSRPSLPEQHDGPGPLLILLLSGMAGLMLSAGCLLMKAALDNPQVVPPQGSNVGGHTIVGCERSTPVYRLFSGTRGIYSRNNNACDNNDMSD